MPTRATRRRSLTIPHTVSARLISHVSLEGRGTGEIVASFNGFSVGLGTFSASVADRAKDLRAGLPLASFASGARKDDRELGQLVMRLARRGLLEYCVGRLRQSGDQVVIEPQAPDYWPQTAPLSDADVLVLSRFAYMRRRGNDMVLESPRSTALFRIGAPAIAIAITSLATPQRVRELRRRDGFPGAEVLALLLDCQIIIKVQGKNHGGGLRPAEGDDNLILWDFHDLLFHARSTQGRQANPLGGVYAYAGAVSPLPAVRPRWPGKAIDLPQGLPAPPHDHATLARLLRERRSSRVFDAQRPITLAELSSFLDTTARVLSRSSEPVDLGDRRPIFEHTARPYPSAGASYELELYLAANRCEGLDRGFYHYDAGDHVLVPIAVGARDFEALMMGAQLAIGAPAAPQVVVTIAARFGRVSWKYSAIAYALILKDVGVLLQSFYMMAAAMGLGGCAIGVTDIELFARMTGIAFHVEGPVGQFAIGRASEPPLEAS